MSIKQKDNTQWSRYVNRLTPNDPYMGRTAPLTSKRCILYTGLSKKMDGIWNRYNLKSTGRIYTFRVLKCSEKFKVLDLP